MQIPEIVLIHLENLAPQLRIELPELIDLMAKLAELVDDGEFVAQILEINDNINEMAADN